MKIAVFSAFPQELKYLKKNSSETYTGGRCRVFLQKHAGCTLIATETGMGAGNLESSFNYVLKAYRPDVVLSVGFGGALYYGAGIGDLVLSSRYFFLTREGAVELPQLSLATSRFNRFPSVKGIVDGLRKKIAIRTGSFITLSEWTAKAKVKDVMPFDALFPVCERETIHLAKLSYKNDLPFFAVRAISDTLDEDIPEEFFAVTDARGNYRFSRALALLLSKPSRIGYAVKLGQNAARAAKILSEAVKALTEVLSQAAASPLPKSEIRKQAFPKSAASDFGKRKV